MTSDSGVDAGATEDAGPTEPALASTVLYRDDFQAYADVSELKSNYPLFSEQRATIDLESSADGGQSLRLDYQSDGGCADAEVFVGKLVAGNLEEVIATWRFRLEAGFLYLQPASHCSALGTGSVELLLTRPADPSGRITLEVSAETENPMRSPAAGVSWRIGVNDAFSTAPRRAVYAQHLRVDSLGPLALTQNEWHRVTLAVRRESSVGGGDGLLRLWIDGAIVLDVQAASTGTAPFSSLRYPTSLRTGASRAQSRWVDDVVLFSR